MKITIINITLNDFLMKKRYFYYQKYFTLKKKLRKLIKNAHTFQNK